MDQDVDMAGAARTLVELRKLCESFNTKVEEVPLEGEPFGYFTDPEFCGYCAAHRYCWMGKCLPCHEEEGVVPPVALGAEP